MTGAAPKTGLDAALAAVAMGGYTGFLAVAFFAPNDGAPAGAGEAASAVSLPAPAVDVELEPAGRVGIESLTGAQGAPLPPMQILVKFEGERGARLRDLFLEDPARAKAAFAEFAGGRAAFKDLELSLMSGSGEATLEYVGPAPDTMEARIAKQREIADKIRGLAGIDYAEPNLIAGIGADPDN